MDRCHQSRVKNALEPEWEARFEPRSYGFRPGRGCHDAIAAIYNTCKGPQAKRVWALDADLAAAFDRIDHDRLLAAIGSFPARDLIRDWLKAGVFEPGKGFAPTEEGTPQGGVISPCLLNVALHGLEEAAGVRYQGSGPRAGDTTRAGSPVLIRYADDLVVLCHSQEQAEQVKARLARWLAPRGLTFNEDKTRVVHLNEGFDFLGVNVRRYGCQAADQAEQGGHQADPATARGRDAHPARLERGGGHRRAHPDHPGLGGLLPERGVIPGVPRTGHPRVAAHLQVGQVGAPQQAEALDHRAVLRHVQQVPATTAGCSATATAAPTWSSSPGPASPATPWSRARPHPMTPPWPATGPNGARRSNPRWTTTPCACSPGSTARCPLCGEHLLTADQLPQSPERWEQWWQQVTRKAIAASYLAHTGDPARAAMTTPASCTPPATAGFASAPARNNPHSQISPAHALAACLSRVPRRVARTVLRGAGRSDAPGLPGGRHERYGPRPPSTTRPTFGSAND